MESPHHDARHQTTGTILHQLIHAVLYHHVAVAVPYDLMLPSRKPGRHSRIADEVSVAADQLDSILDRLFAERTRVELQQVEVLAEPSRSWEVARVSVGIPPMGSHTRRHRSGQEALV